MPKTPLPAKKVEEEDLAILDRIRGADGQPLAPGVRRAKATQMLRHMRWCYAKEAAPLLRQVRDASRALVALKAKRRAAAAWYVGQKELDRRFIFDLDAAARENGDNDGAFEELAEAAEALFESTQRLAEAPRAPPMPCECDAALQAAVDEIEAAESGLSL